MSRLPRLPSVDFVLPHVRQMEGYMPGLQTQDLSFIKLNTNESPFPPSSAVIDALEKAIQKNRLHLYPDSTCSKLRIAIAQSYGLSKEHVLIGNGSDELLSLLFRAVLGPDDGLVLCDLTYSLYSILAKIVHARIQETALLDNWQVDFDGLRKEVSKPKHPYKLVVLANPNAPTSLAETKSDVLAFARDNPVLSLVDEAYAPFMGMTLGHKAGTEDYPRLLVCGTFSKAYSLAGQRIGWLLAHPNLIIQLHKLRDSYNVSYLAQEAALAAWQDQKENKRRIEVVQENRKFLQDGLETLGFSCLMPSANFIFAQVPGRIGSAKNYIDYLASHKILVRHFPKPRRANSFVRITVGEKKDLECLLDRTQQWRAN